MVSRTVRNKLAPFRASSRCMLGQVWIQFLSTLVIIFKSLGQVYRVSINTSVPHILVVYRVYALVIKYWPTLSMCLLSELLCPSHTRANATRLTILNFGVHTRCGTISSTPPFCFQLDQPKNQLDRSYLLAI